MREKKSDYFFHDSQRVSVINKEADKPMDRAAIQSQSDEAVDSPAVGCADQQTS